MNHIVLSLFELHFTACSPASNPLKEGVGSQQGALRQFIRHLLLERPETAEEFKKVSKENFDLLFDQSL